LPTTWIGVTHDRTGDAAEMNRAGAAECDPAAELRAAQADHIAQDPQQGSVGIDVDDVCLAVDGEREWHARRVATALQTGRLVVFARKPRGTAAVAPAYQPAVSGREQS